MCILLSICIYKCNRLKEVLVSNTITREVRDEVYDLARRKDALTSEVVNLSLFVYSRYTFSIISFGIVIKQGMQR